MHRATFFITTARSGTQWLAHGLATHYEDELCVAHEPIGYAYRPKLYLRAHEQMDELKTLPAVQEHLERIHRTLRTKPYVEVGFPCFAMAPLLLRELGTQLHLVQLVRHPVRVAASLVTHRWYQNTRKDTLSEDIELAPSDPGVVQKHYMRRWAKMTPYEKGLFYWTEVHLFGRDTEQTHPSVPFHRVRFEDLIDSPDAMMDLAAFLDIPYRTAWGKSIDTPVDHYAHRTPIPINASLIRFHETTVRMAERFGYDMARVDLRGIESRYRAKPPRSLTGRIRNGLHRIAHPRARSH